MTDHLYLPLLILPFAVGYLLGSIPFGLLLTKLAGTGDIRNVGSGNIGATNVLRTGRKGLAAATLLGDMLKGSAPGYARCMKTKTHVKAGSPINRDSGQSAG